MKNHSEIETNNQAIDLVIARYVILINHVNDKASWIFNDAN